MQQEPIANARLPSALRSHPRGTALLSLAVALLALVGLPLVSLLGAVRSDVARLQAAVVEASVSRIAPVSPEDLATLRTQAEAGEAVEEALQEGLDWGNQEGIAWSAILQRISSPAPQIHVTALSQHQDRVTIAGSADSEADLSAFAAPLRACPLFSAVQISPVSGGEFRISLQLQGRGR